MQWVIGQQKHYINPNCKACKAERERRRRLEKRDEIRKMERARWHFYRRDASREWRKKHYLENKEKIKAQAAASWARLGPISKRVVNHRREPTAEELGISREQWIAQREKRKRSSSYEVAKLRVMVRGRVRSAIAGYGGKGIQILGCSGEFFRNHLRLNLKPGMTMDGMGKDWHIDHYVPLSYFDLTVHENVLVAFNWRNCFPLWKEENLRKQDTPPPDADAYVQWLKSKVLK